MVPQLLSAAASVITEIAGSYYEVMMNSFTAWCQMTEQIFHRSFLNLEMCTHEKSSLSAESSASQAQSKTPLLTETDLCQLSSAQNTFYVLQSNTDFDEDLLLHHIMLKTQSAAGNVFKSSWKVSSAGFTCITSVSPELSD